MLCSIQTSSGLNEPTDAGEQRKGGSFTRLKVTCSIRLAPLGSKKYYDLNKEESKLYHQKYFKNYYKINKKILLEKNKKSYEKRIRLLNNINDDIPIVIATYKKKSKTKYNDVKLNEQGFIVLEFI